MKKAILFRLFAIVFFCLGTLAIKSETSVCNVKTSCLAKSRAFTRTLNITEQRAMPAYPYEGFFIKI